MDNVVQNIKLEDIIPSNFQNNDLQKLNELANSIKEYGIIEPLLVRPQNGKYEIIIGNKRYQAAKMVGLETVPALIKNVDDEVFKQYLKINNPKSNQNSTNKFINPNSTLLNEENPKQKVNKLLIETGNVQQPKEKKLNNIQENTNFNVNYNQNQHTDIINLSELNKEEYERKDFKMNNEQMNNIGVTSTNSMQSMQEPTFGGRFFPSLEDEPTNMNMGGINANSMGAIPQQPANNLIDLTDISVEKGINMTTNQNFDVPQAQSNFTPNITEIHQQSMMNNASMNVEPSPEMPSPIPDPMSNIINIGELQNNNPVVQPEPMMMENSIPTSKPMMEQPQNIPQFDMSQNIAPIDFVQNQPLNIQQTDFTGIPTTDFIVNEPIQPSYVEPTIPEPIVEPEMNTYNIGVEPQINSMPMNEPMTTIEPLIINQKDILPVMNTIKSLVSNLEAFGYKINMSEEELSTSIKLTIEVEK